MARHTHRGHSMHNADIDYIIAATFLSIPVLLMIAGLIHGVFVDLAALFA